MASNGPTFYELYRRSRYNRQSLLTTAQHDWRLLYTLLTTMTLNTASV